MIRFLTIRFWGFLWIKRIHSKNTFWHTIFFERIATHALHVWRTLWGCIHSNPFHAVHGWSFLFRLFTQESLGFSKSKDCHPCVACVADLVGLHSNEKLGLALRALVFFVFSLPLSKLASG